jgi:serine/threonine protein kinase/Tol biopolymer transport system component
MPLPAGSKLGPYQILAQIGAGGMGEVFRARDARLGRDVALKILPEDVSREPRRAIRFEREARAASALNHPNIISVYDVGREGDIAYIVSELVDGESLRHAIAQGPMPARRVVEIATQIAEGLAAAHAAGIVHRDLKPENVMLTREGRVKILDFGLAMQAVSASGDEREDSPTEPLVTNPGDMIGTVGYMSPEQVRGRIVDTRSDIFSAGVIVYEMLAGQRPFTGASPVEVMHSILKDDPRDIEAQIAPALDRIVRRCLEKEPARRFQSVADLGFAMQAISGTSWPPPPGVVEPRATPSRRWLVAGGLLFLIAALFAARTWFSARPVSSQPIYVPVVTSEGNVGSAYFYGEQTLYTFTPTDGERHTYLIDNAGGTRELSIPSGGQVEAISSRGELAILTSSGDLGGTLLRLSLAGGAPRQVLDRVFCAQWAPDGSELAIVRRVGDKQRLEYPIGHALFESTGPIFSCRVSPDGSSVAFVAQDTGKVNQWFLNLANRSGKVTRLGRVAGRELTAFPVLWRPDGREVWYTSFETNELGAIYAAGLNGTHRLLARYPGFVALLDVSPSGKALLTERTSFRRVLLYHDGAPPSDLSWLNAYSFALSEDGAAVALFDFTSSRHEFFVRFTRDHLPVRFENGKPYLHSLSPDGKWIAVSRENNGVSQTVYVPTGPGEEYTLRADGVELPTHAAWLHDSKRFLFEGTRNGTTVWFIGSLDGGNPKPLSGAAVPSPGSMWLDIAPDDDHYYTLDSDGKWWVRHLSGGAAKPIANLSADDNVMSWTADNKAVFVHTATRAALRTDRFDIETGSRTLWREDPEPGGLRGIWFSMITPDGKNRLYTFGRGISSLWIADGLH